ncbi:MAG: aspartate/glutamate racemase family protein [Acetobacter sp.]
MAPVGPALTGAHRVLAFDSGIGGLGIVRALRALAPELVVDYLADTAVFPYGEQDDTFLVERIVFLLRDAVARLKPQAVVVACNTASTLALDALRTACPATPFIGCVPPIRWAARVSRSGVIGLLATRATTRRPYLARLLALHAPGCTLITHAAPGLAGCAERLFRGETVTDATLRAEIQGLWAHPLSSQMDTVGLGCTHYTFVLERMKALAPADMTWLDPAHAVAQHTCTVLEALPPLRNRNAGSPADGRAWFTALPDNVPALVAHLPPFGFDTLHLWPAQPHCAPAGYNTLPPV